MHQDPGGGSEASTGQSAETAVIAWIGLSLSFTGAWTVLRIFDDPTSGGPDAVLATLLRFGGVALILYAFGKQIGAQRTETDDDPVAKLKALFGFVGRDLRSGAGLPLMAFNCVAWPLLLFEAAPRSSVNDFFPTASQVLAGLLIALVLERRGTNRSNEGERRVLAVGLATVVIGTVFSLTGILATDSSGLMVVAFAWTCGAVAAAMSVTLALVLGWGSHEP